MLDEQIYDKDHFWIKQEGDLLIMGMDDFAQKLAGEIVYIELPEDGKNKGQQEVLQGRRR